MSTFAVLGATGNCGTALIDNLLRTPGAHIHAYCRNRNKLLNKVPQLRESKQITIFEGNINDQKLLVDCIKDTKAVFHCVSMNDNLPNCHVGQDMAEAIIVALRHIKAERLSNSKIPKVILLSSATIDDHLSREMPWFVRQVLLTAASHVYEDCRQAERVLREQSDWLTSIFVKPGGLCVDAQRGHRIEDREESFLSYLDLAAAMIEMAEEPNGKYDLRNVGVVNAGSPAKFPPGTAWLILANLLRHFFPWTHQYLPSAGA